MASIHRRPKRSAYTQDERGRTGGPELGRCARNFVLVSFVVNITKHFPHDVMKQVRLHDDGPTPLACPQVLLRSSEILV